MCRFRSLCAIMFLLAVLVSFIGVRSEAEEPRTNSVKIGMIGTLFKDVPDNVVQTMMQPFGALMQSQTGIQGEIIPGGDADSLGADLAHDKVQLAVFHGIEFAWTRVKNPNLKPLMIAINQQRHLRAHLLVRADNSCKDFCDLQNKVLGLPQGSRIHAHVFLERRCQEAGKALPNFFHQITKPMNVEEAIDDLVDGDVQAVVADGVSLEAYKRRKPGRFEKVRVLKSSEVFPAAVIAYRPGLLDEAILTKFKDGMMQAHQTVLGKQLLTLWKLSGFEQVPDDYEQTLSEIVKVYPPPAK